MVVAMGEFLFLSKPLIYKPRRGKIFTHRKILCFFYIWFIIYIFDSDLVRRMRLMIIDWICHTKSESDLFCIPEIFKNERLKSVFEYKMTFWICVLVLWIHKGYFVVKNLVWNVRIKGFWYTNVFKHLRKAVKRLQVWLTLKLNNCFRCRMCKKAFSDSSTLTKHLR